MFTVFSALRAWIGFMSLVMGLVATGTLIDITRSMMSTAAEAHEVGFMSMGAFNRMLLSGGKPTAVPSSAAAHRSKGSHRAQVSPGRSSHSP